MTELRLADGRTLDVVVSGPADGLPLVFHHGTPGAAVASRAFERAVHERGLRLLMLSRPGYGSSTRLPGRAVVDVVADTAAALDSIGADECLMSGWSGGGPHALACAARLPGVRAALLIAGVGPSDAVDLDFLSGMGEDNLVEFGAAVEGEAALRGFLEPIGPGLAVVEPGDIVADMDSLLPPVDKAVMTGEFADDLAAMFHEGLRVGIDGWLDDDLAFAKPWAFELDEIRVPVSVWQGSDDLMVPFAHGRWLAGRVPGASAHLLDGDGHLSIALGAVDRMLDELVASAERRVP